VKLVAWAAFIALCLAAANGRAEEPPPIRKNALSYKPFSITSRGILVQYERLLAPHWSAIGGLGMRSAAREDFASFTFTKVTEGRYWFTARDWASHSRGMAGPFVGLALDASRTSVHTVADDRSLGAMWTVQESLRAGDRIVIWNLQELTLALGFDVIHEFDERGRLAPNTRATLGLDFTVGWMF
jgi:hypothetical protein